MKRESKEILIFLGLTFLISWILMGYVSHLGGLRKAGALVVLIMWIPGLVSLAYRAIAKLGFRDVGWRLGPLKYAALAFFVPLLVAAVSYAIYWSTGLSEFQPPSPELLARNGASSPLNFVLTVYPLIFIAGCLAALGEELGWRGFLIPKLHATPIRHPLVVSSAIWAVWHFPLILWGGYANSGTPFISLLLFTIMILPAGVFVGWLRMKSGSVWVAMIYHGAHNIFLQTAFEVFNKPGPTSPYLGGESGVVPCAVYFLILGVGYWFFVRRDPNKNIATSQP